MAEHEAMDILNVMQLPWNVFLNRMLAWKKEFSPDEFITPDNPLECPINQWVVFNHKKCSRQLVPNTMNCPLCGKPCCPDCYIHTVDQLSRVTGYLQAVSGWNEAKKAEFKDRHRYDLANSAAPRGQS